MTSERKIAANRRNAQKSTGPKTAAGKAVSRMNALKHGVRGHTLLLPGENEEAFVACFSRYFAHYDPRSEKEIDHLHHLTELRWMLDRCLRMETRCVASLLDPAETPESKEIALSALERFARYGATIERRYARARQEFIQDRLACQKGWLRPPENDDALYKLSKLGFLSSRPAAPGETVPEDATLEAALAQAARHQAGACERVFPPKPSPVATMSAEEFARLPRSTRRRLEREAHKAAQKAPPPDRPADSH